jgi:hypothetical protein
VVQGVLGLLCLIVEIGRYRDEHSADYDADENYIIRERKSDTSYYVDMRV